jgi:CMP-N-acetylneuraminic acid synthetase
MSFIGIVPARGGSKRIPRKNLAPCAGRPLIAHTLEAARASRALARTVLSTDDEDIAALGPRWGLEVPFLRPPQLADDAAPMVAVVRHMLDWLRQDGETVTALVLLQPTSPLRDARHIDEAVAIFNANPDCESVLSVVEPPHIFHPLKALRLSGHGLVHFVEDREPAFGRRDLPLVYAVNGPAVVVVRPTAIERGEMYGNPIVPYVMSPDVSIDVDEPLDLAIADFLIRRNG